MLLLLRMSELTDRAVQDVVHGNKAECTYLFIPFLGSHPMGNRRKAEKELMKE